jgi:hypothetical protein
MGGELSTGAENTDYLLDNADPRAERRFDALAQLFDARTIEYLTALGVTRGWSCWEVGAGGGSIAEWLAGAVAPTGSVVATDLDLRRLSATAVPGLTASCSQPSIRREHQCRDARKRPVGHQCWLRIECGQRDQLVPRDQCRQCDQRLACDQRRQRNDRCQCRGAWLGAYRFDTSAGAVDVPACADNPCTPDKVGTTFAIATCPQGTVAIGGGGETYDAGVEVSGSLPRTFAFAGQTEPNAWQVDVDNFLQTTSKVDYYVVCTAAKSVDNPSGL